MRIILAVVVLLTAFSTMSSGAVGTLSPGGVLQVSFTSTANTSDLLWFFTNDPLTITGSPVITTQLYNGQTLLATTVAAPQLFGGNFFYQTVFRTSGSGYLFGDTPTATADFSSIHNGAIQGTVRVTVTGGSISGFDTTHFLLYDGISAGAGFTPSNHIFPGAVALTTPAVVPTLSRWGLGLLAGALMVAGALTIASGRRRANA
jgi:hypothetical protein